MKQFSYTKGPQNVPGMLDITAPDVGVEVDWRDDEKVLWVSVDGVTVLRICQIPKLEASHDEDG